MTGLPLYLVIMIVLFVAAFVFKRRFGVLGMGLAVGAILSDIWTDSLIDLAGQNGIIIESYGPMAVSLIVVMAPVVALFFKGYSCRPLLLRLISSAMFAVLAMAFLIEPLSHSVVVSGPGAELFNMLLEKRNLIIGVGLALAVVDFLLAKPAHKGHHRAHNGSAHSE